MRKTAIGFLMLVSLAYFLTAAGLVDLNRTFEIGRILFVLSLVVAVVGLSIRVISDNSPDEII